MKKKAISGSRRAYILTMRILMGAAAVITAALVLFLIAYVLIKGLPNMSWTLLSTAPSYLSDRIGILPVAGELVHTEELNGEDTIEFETREVPAKGDRLLWRDGETWREHVVVRTDEPLEGLCSVYAESSLCELLDDFIEEQHLVSRTAAQALAVVLAPTRWSIASCDVAGTAGCVLYHVNALWALRRVAEVWDGEVEPVITVACGRVASRFIRFRQRLGS